MKANLVERDEKLFIVIKEKIALENTLTMRDMNCSSLAQEKNALKDMTMSH